MSVSIGTKRRVFKTNIIKIRNMFPLGEKVDGNNFELIPAILMCNLQNCNRQFNTKYCPASYFFHGPKPDPFS